MSKAVSADTAGTADYAGTIDDLTPRTAIPRHHQPETPGPLRARLDLLSWVVPALLATGLGVWRLTVPALWADELATWGAVRLTWAQLWKLSGSVDVVLTPYYAAMKVYTSVAGTSTAALRLPAVVAIVATTALVAALGRRIGGPQLGLFAGLVFALLPVTSRYGQEARSYALVMFAATLAVRCLIRLLERPRLGRATGYAGALLLTSLSQPLSATLVLVGHGIAVFLWQLPIRSRGWRATWSWLAAAAVGGSPAAVLLTLGYGSRGQISWISKLSLNGLQAVPDRVFLTGALGGLVLALAVVAVRRQLDHICLAAAGFGPLVALVVAGAVVPVWVARYVLVVVPPLAVLAAAAALRFGRPQAVATLALLVILGSAAQLDVRRPAGHSEASTKIASVIGPRYRPGDVAVFPDTHPSIPWAPRDIYERYLPAPRPPDVLRTAPQRSDGHFLATECPDANCLGDPSRIWVIRVDNAADPFQRMAPGKQRRLRDHYRVVQRWSYPLLGIFLLARKSPAVNGP